MSQQTQLLYEFGPYRLNPAQQLLAEGAKKIPLTPKAFQTLLVLVESQGRIVTKDELLRKVWPDAFVEEATLAQNVFTLRKQLCDDREDTLYIETVPKQGYRFVAKVRHAQNLLRNRACLSACRDPGWFVLDQIEDDPRIPT